MKQQHLTISTINIMHFSRALFVFFLFLIIIVKRTEFISYPTGNLALLNCVKSFFAEDLVTTQCADNDVGGATQKSTFAYLQTLNAWNAMNYQELTFACYNEICNCLDRANPDLRAHFHMRLQNYYTTLSFMKYFGKNPEFIVCKDDFVPSNFIWFQAIQATDQEWANALWELAYIVDKDWHDSWQRGHTAFKQAERYREVGNNQAAQKAYVIAVDSLQQSNDSRALSYTSLSLTALGELALDQGDLDAATWRFRESIYNSPKSGWGAFTGLIRVWQTQGFTDNDIYQKFVEIRSEQSPEDVYLTSGPSHAFLTLNKIGLAEHMIYSAPREIQDMSPILEVKGLLFEADGDLENAELTFISALNHISINEPLALAQIADHLARIYTTQNNFPAAVTNLELATQFNPEAAYYWYRLSIVYEKTGEFEMARTSLKKAISLEPDNISFNQALVELQK